MKSREEKLWNRLDGVADPEEQAALDRELQGDAELRRELALRRALHENLSEMEAEQPSLRFTQNLMERLPKLYRKIQIGPLVRSGWRRVYLAAFILTVVALLGLGLGASASGNIPLAIDLTVQNFYVALGANIPLQLTVIVTSFTTTLLFLFWLDKRLRKRYEGGGG